MNVPCSPLPSWVAGLSPADAVGSDTLLGTVNPESLLTGVTKDVAAGTFTGVLKAGVVGFERGS